MKKHVVFPILTRRVSSHTFARVFPRITKMLFPAIVNIVVQQFFYFQFFLLSFPSRRDFFFLFYRTYSVDNFSPNIFAFKTATSWSFNGERFGLKKTDMKASGEDAALDFCDSRWKGR